MNQPTTTGSDAARRVPGHQIISLIGGPSVKVPTGHTPSHDVEVIPINAKTTQVRVQCGCGQTISLICESE